MIDLPSEDELVTSAIQLLATAQPANTPTSEKWDLSDKGYFGLLARAWAQLTMQFIKSVEDADNDAIPAYQQDDDGTFLSRLSTAALDAWAITLGLPSGTSGVFGRRKARGSSGGAGIPTCSIGATLIAAGSQLVDSTGQVSFETVSAITTNGPPNTLFVSLISTTTGAAANLPAGARLTWVSPPAGVTSPLTLTSALTNGSDREEDADLLIRILFKLQNPGRGGTAADYRFWTENSTDATRNDASNNIARAYVYPLRSGIGTVDVVPLYAGSGTTRDIGSATATVVQTYLNTVRPVTAVVNVRRPSMLSTRALRVEVICSPYSKYAPDWNDVRATTTITAINSATKEITTAGLPTALVNAYLSGSQPRIAILVSASGASPKPYQARVTSINTPTNTIATVDVWPDVDPVAGTDVFYAGGPYLDTIAQKLLDYIDNLGPSRQSGFADEFDTWEWEVTPARIADAVMESRDEDGTRFIQDIPRLATTGIRIAVGSGAFAADTKFTPLDVFGASTIELAYLRAGGITIYGTPA